MEAASEEAPMVEATAEAATVTEEGARAMVAKAAAAAAAEAATETGTARSTSRCSSCRTSCSQLFDASSSPQTCARSGCSRHKSRGSIRPLGSTRCCSQRGSRCPTSTGSPSGDASSTSRKAWSAAADSRAAAEAETPSHSVPQAEAEE